MFANFIGLLLGVMAAVSCSGMAGDCCSAQECVVREVVENRMIRIVSTARVAVNARDGDSIRLAASQAEMKAKDQLLRYRTEKGAARIGRLKGVILRGSCRSGGYLYVTVETSRTLRRESQNLGQQLKESLSRTPTPTPR